MAGESGQDWIGILYVFVAGMVSVAVEMIRRKAENIDDDEDEKRRERRHRRELDEEEHPHRRWDDDPDDEGEAP